MGETTGWVGLTWDDSKEASWGRPREVHVCPITTQNKKTEPPLAQKGTLVTHTQTLAYEKSTDIIGERRCGPLIQREVFTWSV
jgi:hypothetical protein